MTNDLNQYPILTAVRESGRDDLNWMLKPGERVRYYLRRELAEQRGDIWDEIPASLAYDIATRRDTGDER